MRDHGVGRCVELVDRPADRLPDHLWVQHFLFYSSQDRLVRHLHRKDLLLVYENVTP